MKYCPTCETRFDDEVMRFCTKDGSPLIDEAEPNFVKLPSEELAETPHVEDEDDAAEVTVVRRNVPVPPPGFDEDDFSDVDQRPAERIVVPTASEPVVDPLRTRTAAPYYPPPRQNTFKVVVITAIGTIFLVAIGAVLVMLLRPSRTSNVNVNTNFANQNANYGIDTNFNFNTNSSLMPAPTIESSNISNSNSRSPTPTPSPSATPTPRPSVTPTQTPDIDITPATPRPTVTPDMGRPRISPTPPPPPSMTRTTPRPTPHSTPEN
jgi:hypothetical protein